MKTSNQIRTAAPIDPAGLDQVLLRAAKGVARFAEQRLTMAGLPISIWDGNDGLGKVLEETIAGAKVPNLRFQQLVTPRSVARRCGILPRLRKVIR